MAGEDELTQLFDVWRTDIDAVPYPVFDVDSLTKAVRSRAESPSRSSAFGRLFHTMPNPSRTDVA